MMEEDGGAGVLCVRSMVCQEGRAWITANEEEA